MPEILISNNLKYNSAEFRYNHKTILIGAQDHSHKYNEDYWGEGK